MNFFFLTKGGKAMSGDFEMEILKRIVKEQKIPNGTPIQTFSGPFCDCPGELHMAVLDNDAVIFVKETDIEGEYSLDVFMGKTSINRIRKTMKAQGDRKDGAWDALNASIENGFKPGLALKAEQLFKVLFK